MLWAFEDKHLSAEYYWQLSFLFVYLWIMCSQDLSLITTDRNNNRWYIAHKINANYNKHLENRYQDSNPHSLAYCRTINRLVTVRCWLALDNSHNIVAKCTLHWSCGGGHFVARNSAVSEVFANQYHYLPYENYSVFQRCECLRLCPVK